MQPPITAPIAAETTARVAALTPAFARAGFAPHRRTRRPTVPAGRCQTMKHDYSGTARPPYSPHSACSTAPPPHRIHPLSQWDRSVASNQRREAAIRWLLWNYPRLAPQPVAGKLLATGPLEPTIRTTKHIATLLRHTREVSISRGSNPLNLNIVFASGSMIF
jgi:hypothetical protein